VNKQGIVMIVLGILLLGALGYIGYVQYNQIQQNKQMTTYATFHQGQQYGMTQTITNLMNQVAQCPPSGVPVYAGNITLHVVAIECSQLVAQQQQAR